MNLQGDFMNFKIMNVSDYWNCMENDTFNLNDSSFINAMRLCNVNSFGVENTSEILEQAGRFAYELNDLLVDQNLTDNQKTNSIFDLFDDYYETTKEIKFFERIHPLFLDDINDTHLLNILILN